MDKKEIRKLLDYLDNISKALNKFAKQQSELIDKWEDMNKTIKEMKSSNEKNDTLVNKTPEKDNSEKGD